MIIIGDIHGDITAMQRIVHFAKDEHMVFVGDLLDSFKYNVYDQIKCLDFAFSLIESNRADFIFGNHELSYLHYSCVCSGYNATLFDLLKQENRITKLEALFNKFLYFDEQNLLITHAGLNAGFAKDYQIQIHNIRDRLNTLASMGYDSSPLYRAGRARMGPARVGGIFWNDWRLEFQPIDGLTQVFGHTAVQEIQQNGRNFNIDCLLHSDKVLQYDEKNDSFNILKF